MRRLDELLAEGGATGVFPSARAEVRYQGRVVYEGGTAPASALFDLASITKVMCTTALLCAQARDRLLDVNAPARTWLPSMASDATVADLAFHRSGLPAFKPFFARVAAEHPVLFTSRSAPLFVQARQQVVADVLATPPSASIGASAVYSDLGFIALGEIASAVAGQPLDVAFTRTIAAPLGLTAHFRPIGLSAEDVNVVDTGGTRPREPAPGQEALWACPAWPSRGGEVDDDNAWVMGGVAGHAGLFGTASDVAQFGQAVLSGAVASPVGWRRDSTPASTRAFGFDTPSDDTPSCGARFGRAGPLGAIGHLGFTGTSVWIDRDRELVVALLTNRVGLGRANVKIRAFRPRFHDAVLAALSL